MSKSTYIQIRCTPEEKDALKAVAKDRGLNVSDWVRLQCGLHKVFIEMVPGNAFLTEPRCGFRPSTDPAL